MMPVGLLMKEHRVIERMIWLMKDQLHKIEKTKQADVIFIDKALDFIRTYADKCHHGKEEDILFRDLLKKRLLPEHKKTLAELIEDHIYARKTTKGLRDAKERYAGGDKQALNDIQELIGALVELYPGHIEKEDKHFFLPVMDYLDKQAQDAMLCEFREFDMNLIHEKYKAMVQDLENKGEK